MQYFTYIKIIGISCLTLFVPTLFVHASATTEFQLSIVGVECFDGIDNDSDGNIDYPDDVQCTDASDTTESAPACSDTLDNDSDGLTDYPDDPDCTSADDTSEETVVEEVPSGSLATGGYSAGVSTETSTETNTTILLRIVNLLNYFDREARQFITPPTSVPAGSATDNQSEGQSQVSDQIPGQIQKGDGSSSLNSETGSPQAVTGQSQSEDLDIFIELDQDIFEIRSEEQEPLILPIMRVIFYVNILVLIIAGLRSLLLFIK